ncbi:MAG TPA: ATP-binding cassette domain-containing protein [Chthoniobacteraceae bacterium]|nr:ATP-binding cassette domain-containing protein [Chthoniobacteraceae bacterium]
MARYVRNPMTDTGNATSGGEKIIVVKNLVKTFKDFRAVDDISFEVEAGKIFGFLGPNGAGKTTTIKMLTTTLAPTSGTVLLDGHDPRKSSLAARRSFGIVFQDPSLDSELTAHENMKLHAVLYRVPWGEQSARIEAALKFVGLWDRRASLAKTFSGGMKRRLEIARSLLHTPRILFLDEPTLGLDPQTRNHIWEYIQTLARERKMTVFFTTHYMDEADRVADNIAIIDRGKIIASGPPAALKRNAGAATLEEAFIALTGHAIREEEATTKDRMRDMGRIWGRR